MRQETFGQRNNELLGLMLPQAEVWFDIETAVDAGQGPGFDRVRLMVVTNRGGAPALDKVAQVGNYRVFCWF